MSKDPLTGEAKPWHDFHKQYIDGSVDGDLPMTRLSEMFNVNHFIVSQVNPHVVPFLPKESGPTKDVDEGPSFFPRWMNTMTHLAKDEVLHRMNVLSELGVFSTSMTKLASIVNQKYSGDINIYPELISSNFPRILENPTTEFMLEACLSGERATWPRLSRIRNHCAIELALDRAIQQMRARVTFSPTQIEHRIHNSLTLSTDSVSSTASRGRIRNRRRGSHSQELERRRSKGTTVVPMEHGLRKARSTVSLENPPASTTQDLPPTTARSQAHQRRSSTSFADGMFEIEAGSDEDDAYEFAFTARPRLPNHSTLWDHSLFAENLSRGSRSPGRSGPSSFSGRSQRSVSGQRASPKQAHAPSPREVSMALSPSSRHLLNMTPTVNSNSPDAFTQTSRH